MRRLLLIGVVMITLASNSLAQESKPVPAAGVVLSRIEPFSPIFVPCTVFGESESMIFDTGSSYHVLNERHLKRLGPVKSNEMVYASQKRVGIKLFKCPQMSVGDFSAGLEQPVTTFAMKPLSEPLGRDVDGLVGAPFLVGRIVELNFDDGQLVVHNKDNWKRDPNSISVSIVEGPRNFSINSPVVGGVTGPYNSTLMVDTGFSGELGLPTEQFDLLVKNGLLEVGRSSWGMGIDGKHEVRAGVVDSFLLGAFRHESVRVSESARPVIGLGYLSRFNVVFDYDNKKIYLKESDRFNAGIPTGKSGIGMLWVNEQVVVDYVTAGSPAETSGVRKADVILKIDGQPVAGRDFPKIRGILSQEVGTRVALQLQRSGETMNVELTLAECD